MTNRQKYMSERVRCKRKPRKCPTCGFKPMGVILYGMPMWSEQFQKDVDNGRLIVGGCCVTDDDPTWECKNCGQHVYKKKRIQNHTIDDEIKYISDKLSQATSLEKLLEILQSTEAWFNSYHLDLVTNKGLAIDPASGKYIQLKAEANSKYLGWATRKTRKVMKIFMDSLVNFGGERPDGTLVRSWDQDHVLIGGSRSTHTWRIVPRSDKPFN